MDSVLIYQIQNTEDGPITLHYYDPSADRWVHHWQEYCKNEFIVSILRD
jgi:hypothetical protein